MELRIEIIANTKPIFAILDPIMLLIAIEGESFIAAFKLTKSSGVDVAKATTVIPIINFDILNLREIAIEVLTINSPPITSNKNPKKIYITFIYLIIILKLFTLLLFEIFRR